MQDLRQLPVWQKAHPPGLRTDALPGAFPKREPSSLTRQMRRAATAVTAVTAITADVAEGRGRGGDADFARFVFMAMGSACEPGSHLGLAKDLDFLSQPDHRATLDLLIEVERMPASLIQKLSPNRRPAEG